MVALDPRRAFGSSTSTWVTGWVVAAAMVAATALIESIWMSGDTWQYLATFLLGYFLVAAWSVAGAIVGVASLFRSKAPWLEPTVNVLLALTIVVAVVVWTGAAVATIADNGY